MTEPRYDGVHLIRQASNDTRNTEDPGAQEESRNGKHSILSGAGANNASLATRPSDVILQIRDEERGGISGVTMGYKPLPPVPRDIKQIYTGSPPSYDSLSVHYVSSQLDQQAVRSSTSAGSRQPLCPTPPQRGTHGSRTVTASQTVACAFLACLCIPVLGWVPLAFACIAISDDDISAEVYRQTLRRYVLILSVGCIMIGMLVSTAFLVRCINGGTCAETLQTWKHWHLSPGMIANSSMNSQIVL